MVGFLGLSCAGQELGWMIHVDLFQLGLFYDSVMLDCTVVMPFFCNKTFWERDCLRCHLQALCWPCGQWELQAVVSWDGKEGPVWAHTWESAGDRVCSDSRCVKGWLLEKFVNNVCVSKQHHQNGKWSVVHGVSHIQGQGMWLNLSVKLGFVVVCLFLFLSKLFFFANPQKQPKKWHLCIFHNVISVGTQSKQINFSAARCLKETATTCGISCRSC